MKHSILALTVAASFAAGCAIKVNVKKDAKNSALASEQNQQSMNLADKDDFLKHLDGLRTTAADIIIKQMAQKDYVGSFRGAVRKYRQFIIDQSQKSVVITDSFYEDSSKECRDSGLSLNGDKHNEYLGIILKTIVLASISEVDLGKINTGLPKEIQALTQFIKMELGVDIQGSSEAKEENGKKITSGVVKLKLKPIEGESIDDATKKADATQVLTLNFNRSLGDDMVGNFIGTIDLSYEKDEKSMEANGTVEVSRVKDGKQHVHTVALSFGTKGETPNYSREIIVRDSASNSKRFEFTDILNAGSSNESSNTTIIDLNNGKQCKGHFTGDDKSSNEGGDKTKDDSSSGGKGDTGSGGNGGSTTGGSTTGSTTGSSTPIQTPTQSPSQTPTQSKVK